MVSSLPVVVKAQPFTAYIEDEVTFKAEMLPLQVVKFEDIVRERLGWEQREKALLDLVAKREKMLDESGVIWRKNDVENFLRLTKEAEDKARSK